MTTNKTHYPSARNDGYVYYADNGMWWRRHTDAPHRPERVLLLDVLVGVTDQHRMEIMEHDQRMTARADLTLYTESAPAARLFDPATSHAAARSVNRERLIDTQRAIVTLLAMRGGMTDDEISEAWNETMTEPVSPSGLRTRRSELVKLGRVKDSGQRRKLATGRSAIVWETT